MGITTITSREFNQNVSRAKRASNLGPVFITNRNKPEHVLLSMDEYQKLKGEKSNLLDALSMPGLAEIEFEPRQARIDSIQTTFC